MQPILRHPVLRYGNYLVLGVIALGSLVISGLTNPHSVAWLMGVYLSLLFLIEASRRMSGSPLLKSYCLYIATMNQYLLIVWFLHVYVPGPTAGDIQKKVLFWAHALGLGSALIPIAMYSFTLRFSEVKSRILYAIEGLGWLVAAFIGVANFTGDFTPEYKWAGVVWVPVFHPIYMVYFYYTSLFVTLTCAVPFVKLFMRGPRERKLQLLWYFIGAAPVYVTCWSHFLISLGINLYPLGGLFFVIHVVIIAYAVLYRQVFDIQIVIRRGLTYGAVSLLFGMLYGAVLTAVSFLSRQEISTNAVLSGSALVVLAGFCFSPFLAYLQSAVDKLFFREELNRQSLFERFAHESAATIDLAVLSELLCRLLEKSLNPRRIQLFINTGSGSTALFGEYSNGFQKKNWPVSETFPDFLREAHAAGRQSVPLPEPAAGAPAGISIAEGADGLLVPVVKAEETLGYLWLEPRRADEPYSEADVRFVKMVAAHAAVAVQNARSFAQMQQLQALTTRVLEGLTVGVLVLEGSGKIVRVNDAAKELIARGKPDTPLHLSELFETLSPVAHEIEAALRDKNTRINKELSLNGTNRTSVLLSTSRLMTSGENDLCLVLLHDITEYREMEQLAQRRGHLAHLGEMVSAINHEIKNILQPVQYQVSRLASAKKDDAVFERAMEIIPDRLTSLDRLLANLRDLARPIDLRPRTLELEDMIGAVLRDVQELPAARGVELKLTLEPDARSCHADGHWMRQVLYNLGRNAVEATEQSPKRLVEFSTRRCEGTIQISVTDTGKGIRTEDLKQLFKPFFTTKAEAGTGLGLSISQKVIELHRGKIDVQSEPGRGTTVIVSLPAGVLQDTPRPHPSSVMPK
ncbi:MAG TPA: ATP-binding protein [Planctomycetota bacterium]|nr:ATP-binding protein [Planctomycetota bacterium]